MNSCEFTFLISSLACCIADGKSAEEVNFIGSALAQLGDTLVAIGARNLYAAPNIHAVCHNVFPEISDGKHVTKVLQSSCD